MTFLAARTGSREAIIKRLEEKFQYPMFIKPPNMGSSIGVSKANDRAELVKGVGESLKYDTKVLVEKYIDGRELECAVLGNDELIVSLPGEILPSEEFYDYKAKYFDGGKSRLMIPANIPEDTVKQIQKYALEAFRAADCSGLSRVDFFLEKSTGNIYLNEINTLPGFTNISMYPKLLGHLGISYAEVLERLIDLAVERFKAKNRN